MVRLYIQNKEVELTDDVQFAITSQFEDLSNPTTIINDWSKTVSIPFTQNNNELFGHIYNPDKVIVEGGGSVGIYFNPLKKLDFRLEWNSAVLMQGYAKMNQVKMNGDKGTYEITLFGELGKVFSELQKITFDKSSVLTDYIIEGEKYVDTYINQDLVFSSWISGEQLSDELKEIGETGYRITDIMGYAPNNSFNEEFDYKSFQTDSNNSKTFEDVLEYKDEDNPDSKNFFDYTGIEPSTAIPDGLLPREIGEYRSYYQLPWIYWNKLFQIFKAKAEEVTGYNIELNKEWFNTLNPYWYNLVYMLKTFDAKDGSMMDDANYYTANPYGSMGWQKTSSINTMTTHRTVNLCTYTNGTNVETVPMIDLSVNFSDGKWFTLDDTNMNPIFKIKTLWKIYDGDGSSSTSHLNNNNGLIIKVNAVGENGHTESVKFFVKSSGCSLTEDGATTIIFDGSTKSGDNDLFNIDANFLVTKAKFGNSIRFRFEAYWKNSNWSLSSNGDIVYLNPYTVNNPNFTYVTILNGVHRSFAHFTLNDLWNNDYSFFGEILKYCKMFRIGIFIDDLKKSIKFIPLSTYFSNYTITDWTDKVDKSKDFTIKPITFENKYVLFNYNENKTKVGKEYKEKYGVNYGEYRLVTDYNFNNDTTNLFDKVAGSVTNTDNVLSWSNLYDYHKLVYSFPAEIYINCKDKDKKYVDVFGQFYFHNGLTSFSNEASLHLRSVNISDDTAFQQANNTYFYTQGAEGITPITTYPKLDVVFDNQMCLFNVPMENYTYLNNYVDKNSIYSNLWDSYINERYNIQNKQITCYMDIKPIDYCNFDFNHFVKIGNQLCMINKIYNYDVTSNATTKVDLITIQDVKGYADNDYLNSIDELTLSYTGMTYLGGGTGDAIEINTFTSISDVTFENGSTSYTTRGILFTISGNTIYAERIEEYVDEEDLEFTITIKNKNGFAEFDVTRYSVYPYPYISITDGDGNVVTTLSRNTTYRLNWECTETEGLENKPTVTLTRIAGLVPTLGSDWTVEEKMYGDGTGAEYFRSKYSVSLTTGLSVGTFSVKIVDVEGWNQTVNY